MIGSSAAPALAADSADSFITKTQKLVARVEKRVAKFEAKRVIRVERLDEVAQKRDDTLGECESASLTLAVAEMTMADVLTLPEGTPDELATKVSQLAEAKKALKAATKASKGCSKRLKRLDKSLVRHNKRLAKLDERLAELRAELLGHLESLGDLTAPFSYRTWVERDVDVRVTGSDGKPRSGVRVIIASPEPKPSKNTYDVESRRRCHAQGITGVDGRMTSRVRLPAASENVDVVVIAPGFRGPYTIEALRKAWGPTAPASRVTKPAVALSDVHVSLEAVQ